VILYTDFVIVPALLFIENKTEQKLKLPISLWLICLALLHYSFISSATAVILSHNAWENEVVWTLKHLTAP
jgi:hypothetical protein